MQAYITGMGMISSVGYDALTTCASVRAGIVRAQPLEHFKIVDEENNEIAITGCPISPITDGFGTVPRWKIMAEQAFIDLIESSSLPGAEDVGFWSRTGVVFTTPSLDSAHLDFEGVLNRSNAREVLIDPFITDLGMPIDLTKCFVVDEDSTAFVKACERIDQFLEQEGIDRAVLISVDSYIEANSLQWLDFTKRLKTPSNPVGLMPGEAAALLFETSTVATQRNTTPLAQIAAQSRQFEENNFLTEEVNAGDALGTAIKATLIQASLKQPFSGDIYPDVNGEFWRSQEYGLAKGIVPRELLDADSREFYPATFLGDIGNVHIASCLCQFIQSQRRSYSKATSALILASSAVGYTGSLLVKAA